MMDAQMLVITHRAHELIRPLYDVEKETIETAMILCEGNIALAARCLKICRQTLHSRIERYRADDKEAI